MLFWGNVRSTSSQLGIAVTIIRKDVIKSRHVSVATFSRTHSSTTIKSKTTNNNTALNKYSTEQTIYNSMFHEHNLNGVSTDLAIDCDEENALRNEVPASTFGPRKKKKFPAGSIRVVMNNLNKVSPNFLSKFLFQQCLAESPMQPHDIARISKIFVSQVNKLSYRDAFRIMESCYLANFVDFDLFKCLAIRIVLHLRCLTANEISRLAFLFSRAGIIYAPLYTGLSARFTLSIKTALPADLTRMAIAYGRLGLKDEQLFHTIADESILQLAHFSPPELCHLLLSYALVNLKPSHLISNSIDELEYKISGMSAEELSLVMFSFAKFNISHPKITSSLEQLMLSPLIEREKKEVPESKEVRNQKFKYRRRLPYGSTNELEFIGKSPHRGNRHFPRSCRAYDPPQLLIDQLSSSQLADLAISTTSLGLVISSFLGRYRSSVDLSKLSWTLLCRFGLSVARSEAYSYLERRYLPSLHFWILYRQQLGMRFRNLNINQQEVWLSNVYEYFHTVRTTEPSSSSLSSSSSSSLSIVESKFPSVESLIDLIDTTGHLVSRHLGDTDWDNLIIQPLLLFSFPLLVTCIDCLTLQQLARVLRGLRSIPLPLTSQYCNTFKERQMIDMNDIANVMDRTQKEFKNDILFGIDTQRDSKDNYGLKKPSVEKTKNILSVIIDKPIVKNRENIPRLELNEPRSPSASPMTQKGWLTKLWTDVCYKGDLASSLNVSTNCFNYDTKIWVSWNGCFQLILGITMQRICELMPISHSENIVTNFDAVRSTENHVSPPTLLSILFSLISLDPSAIRQKNENISATTPLQQRIRSEIVSSLYQTFHRSYDHMSSQVDIDPAQLYVVQAFLSSNSLSPSSLSPDYPFLIPSPVPHIVNLIKKAYDTMKIRCEKMTAYHPVCLVPIIESDNRIAVVIIDDFDTIRNNSIVTGGQTDMIWAKPEGQHELFSSNQNKPLENQIKKENAGQVLDSATSLESTTYEMIRPMKRLEIEFLKRLGYHVMVVKSSEIREAAGDNTNLKRILARKRDTILSFVAKNHFKRRRHI